MLPACGYGNPGATCGGHGAEHGAHHARRARLAADSLRGQDAQALAGLPTDVTVRFEAGQLQGFDGCNQLVGSYTIDRDMLDLHRADGERVLFARRGVK